MKPNENTTQRKPAECASLPEQKWEITTTCSSEEEMDVIVQQYKSGGVASFSVLHPDGYRWRFDKELKKQQTA